MKKAKGIIIEYQGRKFKYDFNSVTVEQAELAREVIEFKHQTFKNPPTEFKQVLKSRSYEWLTMALSYLLLEVKENQIVPFNRDSAEMDTEKWIKKLPISFRQTLMVVVNDFFINIGLTSVILEISSGERKQSASEILMPLFVEMMAKKLNTQNT